MRRRGDHKSASMGIDPIWRLLFRFSGPAIIAMMVAASYHIVDTIFVGRLGTNALAAITISHPIVFILLAVVTGTGVGAASLISRKLGAGQYEYASRVVSMTTTLSIIIGALMVAVCLPNLEWILSLFGAGTGILPLAKSYLSVLVIFAVVDSYFMIMGSIIRAEGSPVFSSVVTIISALVNIILDPFLIFGWGPFPVMGIAGAAIATVTARGVGALLFASYFIFGKSSVHFRISYFVPKLKIIKEIYRVGFAAMVRMGGWSVLLIFVNRIVISYGVTPLAVFGVLNRASSFARMPSHGISQGLLPLVGYNFGAQKMKRVGEILIKSYKVTLVWGVVCAIILVSFPTQILSIFNSEPDFLAQGRIAIMIFSVAYIVMGIQFNSSSFFQGIGKGTASLITGLAREFIFILPIIYIFTRIWGQNGIWLTFPVADTLAVILAIVWIVIQSRRLGIHFQLRYPSKATTADFD